MMQLLIRAPPGCGLLRSAEGRDSPELYRRDQCVLRLAGIEFYEHIGNRLMARFNVNRQ